MAGSSLMRLTMMRAAAAAVVAAGGSRVRLRCRRQGDHGWQVSLLVRLAAVECSRCLAQGQGKRCKCRRQVWSVAGSSLMQLTMTRAAVVAAVVVAALTSMIAMLGQRSLLLVTVWITQ